MVVVQTNDISGLTPRFGVLVLSFDGDALYVGVEEDVERLSGLSVDGVGVGDGKLVEEGLVGQAPGDAILFGGEQVERDGSGVVGWGLLPGGLMRGEHGLDAVPDLGGD